MKRILAIAIIALLSLVSAVHAAESPARNIVASLHGTLLDVMIAADELGFEGRRDYLAPAMTESYDMTHIARGSTGRYWRQASDEQKQRIVDAITRLSITIYAARFDGFSGERFRTLSEEPAPRGTVLVKTEIVKSDGDTVALNYLMRDTQCRCSRPRIVTVRWPRQSAPVEQVICLTTPTAVTLSGKKTWAAQ